MSIRPAPCSVIFQCPNCKSLTKLEQFLSNEDGVAILCLECEEPFFLAVPEEEHKILISLSKKLQKSSKTDTPKKRKRKSSTSQPAVVSSSFPVIGAATKATDEEKEKGQGLSLDKSEKAQKVLSRDDPDFTCPKCSAKPQEGDEECRRCGLAFANVGVTFVPKEQSELSEKEEHAIGVWDNVLSDWEDEALHEKFLQYCALQDLFEFAASCYREELVSRANDELGQQMLNRIIMMAQSRYLDPIETTDTKEKTDRWKLYIILILLVLGAVFMYLSVPNGSFRLPSLD